MRDKYGVRQDPYCYPESDVLINKLNITDHEKLEAAEYGFTLVRAEDLKDDLVLDLTSLQSIHKHLFQDLYEWAGELRTVDISKGDTRFCTCARIEAEANKIFYQLNNDTINKDNFYEKAAYYYCELNLIHPFREGNGRSQRVLFEIFFNQYSYEYAHWEKITKTDWDEANIAGVHCDYSYMEAIMSTVLSGADY